MNIRFILAIIILMSLTSCKTKKETISSQPTPSEQKKELTNGENQQMSQLEYIPEDHQKPLTLQGVQVLDNLALEKANMICKKQEFLKRIEAGEKVDPSDMTKLDLMLEEFNQKIVKYENEPTYMQYFEEKLAENLKGCSN
jgi:hypothetical protein